MTATKLLPDIEFPAYTTEPPAFMDWWKELNARLFWQGQADASYGAAKFWFGQKVAPDFAADAIASEREYP